MSDVLKRFKGLVKMLFLDTRTGSKWTHKGAWPGRIKVAENCSQFESRLKLQAVRSSGAHSFFMIPESK